MRHPKNQQRLASETLEPADNALLDELLGELELDAPTSASPAATSPALSAVGAKLSKRSAQPAKSRSPSAVAERKRYAKVKSDAGLGAPRAYEPTNIAPRRLADGVFETEEEYQKRYKREHARQRRGVTAKDIEANADIRAMTTLEEKKRQKADAEKARRAAMTQADKDADAERKRVSRAAKKTTPSAD